MLPINLSNLETDCPNVEYSWELWAIWNEGVTNANTNIRYVQLFSDTVRLDIVVCQ